ncbi:MAG: hypothetical protein ABIQ11_07185 [Saprospiraceae bacterium]
MSEQKDITGILPDQYTGKSIEAQSSVELSNEQDARNFYHTVKARLLDINQWHQLAGVISAKFQLVDAQGEEVEREPQIGDYFKIDIPGPGSKDGDGYDWASIEAMNEVTDGNNQSIGLRVRPCPNPLGGSQNVAHFYSEESTCSFIIKQEGTSIHARIIDRNVKPNDVASSLMDKLRDSAVGIGAIIKFSELQWKNLVEGFVKPVDQ